MNPKPSGRIYAPYTSSINSKTQINQTFSKQTSLGATPVMGSKYKNESHLSPKSILANFSQNQFTNEETKFHIPDADLRITNIQSHSGIPRSQINQYLIAKTRVTQTRQTFGEPSSKMNNISGVASNEETVRES
jgi:hypothetical protein